jgi:hypothetical protein
MEKLFCIPVAAELHEGATALRKLQDKEPPKVNGVEKSTVTTLMAKLLSTVASNVTEPCVAVLDAYFAVAPVFAIAKSLCRKDGKRQLHIITRARVISLQGNSAPLNIVAAVVHRSTEIKFG